MRLVEEALSLWRHSEELLAQMPPTHPERTEIVWIAHRARRMMCDFSRSERSATTDAASRQALVELRTQAQRFDDWGHPS